eukprot:CAMPEP_0118632892 /NCGR_PEP_ID=MMETSP0785-20121206/696_1 /TAXON_ID=91992 /ORGANISM="Bolidomonas pacifica, Strain CCMP 1866" /LENGTH=176 /DNA_ID=CAMNT_0006523711 /DNA_START=658 /DNA_END=1185 /DNA_ORIENTATION=+
MTTTLDEIVILSKDANGLALRSLLQTALNSPTIVHLSPLLHLPSPPSDCPSMPFFKLVEIYHEGDVKGYQQWKEENGKTGINNNFDAKFSVVSFLRYAFASPSPKLVLKGLCDHLNLTQDEVEKTIRSAIYQGFYEGKISHLGGSEDDFVLGSVTYDFGWKGEGDIQGILEGLKSV